MGEERMKVIEEAFEEMSSRVLPSPVEDAYLDALHTNNLIEYEPEYLMEFDRNPDIDDTPPMSLEEVLQKAKPFLMAYEGIKSQEEWEELDRVAKTLPENIPSSVKRFTDRAVLSLQEHSEEEALNYLEIVLAISGMTNFQRRRSRIDGDLIE
ncbi:uncharacterized protein A4U43_C06F1500 [Asparagus officinalis]|uniref:Uncharacterized protein n=1 Tax=Asparagus officinalis TaxID=4686 RepID=A0A5P1EM16_ASPOF|nr:uncharacterized protein A4U43_C06F1500 [Asparagus officinalis]